MIFRNISISIAFLLSINVYLKFSLSLIIIALGFISIQKFKNETRTYELIVHSIKYLITMIGKSSTVNLNPKFELLNEVQQAVFADLLRTITIPCKVIKTNQNYDFIKQINNLKSQKTKKVVMKMII